MTRMKLRSRIFVGGFLVLACLAGYFLGARPQPYPVGLTMIGFQAAPSDYDPTILFQLTNHTASTVSFDYTSHKTNTSGLTSPSRAPPFWFSDGAGHYALAAHSATKLEVCIPRDTPSGWRGQIVFTASRQQMAWLARMNSWISRVGLPPVFTARERTYPKCTNVWTE